MIYTNNYLSNNRLHKSRYIKIDSTYPTKYLQPYERWENQGKTRMHWQTALDKVMRK